MRASRTWLALVLPCLLLPGTPRLARVARPMRAAPPDESLVARARDAVAASEYEARPNAHGLQAPNRANGLRTYFAPDGVSLHDRGNAEAPALLDLSLSDVGRADRLAKVAAGELAHDGARVEIRRPGLAEWYVNSLAGLEQGFTVERRPPGDGALVLELHFAGATATAQGDGELLFHAATGRSLRLGALRAQDAQGRRLDARFELAGADRLRLVVADATAAYPVTIDPLLSATFDTTFAASQAGAFLGCAVAIADTNGDGYADVVIGAEGYDSGQADEGAVFVFNGGPSGIANGGPAMASALLQGNQAGIAFGAYVATGDFNGDGYADVVVSAPDYGSGGGLFIFPGGPFGIEDGNPGSAQTAVLGSTSRGVGYPMACPGDVNGDGYDDLIATTDSGDVWILYGASAGIPSGPVTSAATHLTGPDDTFGEVVAGAGDVNGDGIDDVIVGDYTANTDTGAVYVFLGSASGIASGTASSAAATLGGDATNEEFGFSAAGAGDVNGDGYADIVVGSFAYGATFNGAAFVFLGGPSGIASGGPATAAAALLSDANRAGFGTRIAGGDVNGDGYSDVVITAAGYSGASASEGAAFVFLGGPLGIPSTTTLASAYARLTGSQSNTGFGDTLAVGDVNGDGSADVLVGSYYEGTTFSQEGAAYLSLGGPGGLVNQGIAFANSTIESNKAGAYLGAIVNAGDLNGDGFDDIAVGAPDYDLGETGEGIVLVFDGSANGLPATLNPATANAVIRGNAAGMNLGLAIAGAGDVNGDGYGDLLLGAPNLGPGGVVGSAEPGAALLYLGGPSGLPALATPANATAVLVSDNASSQFGESVAGIGDVNGDGFADIAIGAPTYGTSGGAVFVFDGSLAGIGSGSVATASATLVGGQSNLGFGETIAAAGDVNGDGFSDLAVGAPLYTNGQTDEGAVLVYHGSANGIASGSLASANSRLESNENGVGLGGTSSSIASAGDFNGDGYDDLLVGSEAYVNQLSNVGAIFLHEGGASGIASGGLAPGNGSYAGTQSGVGLGVSAGGIGDVNGDGLADVAFGATSYAASPGGSAEGAVFIVLGTRTLVFFTPSWTMLSGVTTGPLFGSQVAGADVNGDGYSDLLVGATSVSDPQSGEGGAYVFYGNQLDRGRAVRLRQRRAGTSSVQLAPLGRAVAPNGFSAELTASDPNGRGRVAAAFEACPRGSAFGSASCVSTTTPYSLVGGSTPTAVLSTTFSGLTANTLYHWRARVLYANSTGPIPPTPFHTGWRRPGARAALEDVRTGADTDGDGVPDASDNCPLVANPSQADTGGLGPGSAPDKIGDACQCGSVAGDGHVDATDVAAYRAALANPTGAALSADAQTRCRVLGRTGGCDIRQVSAIRRAIASPSLLPIQSGPAAQFCVAALGS